MRSTKIAAAAVALLLLLATPRVHAACTNTTLAGTFGFTTTGTLILPTGPAPLAAVGPITFGLNGHASGSQDRSVGGVVAHEKISGPFTFHDNCTINLVANVFDDSGNLTRTSTLSGVLIDNGNQIRAIFESVALPDGTNLPSILIVEASRIQRYSEYSD